MVTSSGLGNDGLQSRCWPFMRELRMCSHYPVTYHAQKMRENPNRVVDNLCNIPRKDYMDCMFVERDRVLKDKAFLQLQENEDNYYKYLKEQQQQKSASSSWFGGGGKPTTPVETIPPISSLSNPPDAQTLAKMEQFVLYIEPKLKDFPEETAKWVNRLAVKWSNSHKEGGGKEQVKTKGDRMEAMRMAQQRKRRNPHKQGGGGNEEGGRNETFKTKAEIKANIIRELHNMEPKEDSKGWSFFG